MVYVPAACCMKALAAHPADHHCLSALVPGLSLWQEGMIYCAVGSCIDDEGEMDGRRVLDGYDRRRIVSDVQDPRLTIRGRGSRSRTVKSRTVWAGYEGEGEV